MSALPTQSETIAKLAAALAAFQASVNAAPKTSLNPHFKSKYADLATVIETIRADLAANGLAFTQQPVPGNPGELRLRTMLLHVSGEWLSSELAMPLAKADPQGYGSAMTYARRYALAAILGVVQDDDDGNLATRPAPTAKAGGEGALQPPPASDEQKASIGELVQALGWNIDQARDFLQRNFDKTSRQELSTGEAGTAIAKLRELMEKPQLATNEQVGRIAELMRDKGWTTADGRDYIVREFGKASRAELTVQQADAMIAHLRGQPARDQAA